MVTGIVVALADPAGRDAFAGIGFAVPIGAAISAAARNRDGTGDMTDPLDMTAGKAAPPDEGGR